MAEEMININQSESGEEMSDNGIDYISTITEMKKNSVDRKLYDEAIAREKKLIKALAEGQQIDLPKEEPVNIAELRNKLYMEPDQLSNLEYIENTLKLRDAIIANGEPDPFLRVGDKAALTQDAIDKAEHVASVLKECVEFAQGDSGIFTAELQRRTVDAMPMRGRR